MTLTAPHTETTTDRPVRPRRRRAAKRVGRVAVAASLTVIALLVAVDVVGTAPSHAAAARATFETVAPPAGSKPRSAQPDDRWAADESAGGTDSNSAH